MEPPAPRRYQRYALFLVGAYFFYWLLRQLANGGASTSSSLDPSTPTWQNFSLVASATRPVESNVMVPKLLWHLASPSMEERFKKVWIFSAFVDTRSMAFGGPPEITMVAASSSVFADRIDWTDIPLWCYVAMKKKGRKGEETFFKVHATVTAIPDGHVEAKTMIPVLYTCPIVIDGEIPAWRDHTIYVTMAAENRPPPHDVFTAVTPLPELDPQGHREGLGNAAVCFQPLVGDTYASSLRDFISYYRILGFNQFYVYLLDPGPETLAIVRDLQGNDGVLAIRWTLPVAWLFTQSTYRVNPREWKIPSMETLSVEEEYKHATSGSDPPKLDVNMWAFGQNAAHHDCAFRAKANGVRWVANVDWDEYLYLRPPSGYWPPPPSVPGASHLTNWALTYDQDSLLPAAFEFQSAFTCSTCQPVQSPASTEAVKELTRRHPEVSLLHPTPAIPSIFVSPIRHYEWFIIGYRCKSIIDPWAWFSSTIHQPIYPYISYAAVRCSDWLHRRTLATGTYNGSCAFPYDTIFKSTPGYTVPPPVSNSTSNKDGTLEITPFSTGAMYHLRASSQVARAIEKWEDLADRAKLDLYTSETGSSLLDSERVGKKQWGESISPETYMVEQTLGDLIEDWNIVSSFGGKLADIIDERSRRPLKRWAGDRWVGGAERPSGGLLWVVALTAVGVGVALITAVRRIMG